MTRIALLLTALIALSGTARAADIDVLEKKIDILTEEVERLKLGSDIEPQLKSIEGFGPAASKVYQKGSKKVSIGGYGEMVYTSYDKKKQNATLGNKKDTVDFLRAILYVGYKYNDWITFNSEIEFEHATSGKNGEVGVEMAALDLKPWDFLGFRTGLLLLPMGWTNELHEPPVFHGVNRPSVESKIIPTTWRENGFGIFGSLGPVRYKSYAVVGAQAAANGANSKVSGFSSSGIRNGRTKGSKSLANSWAYVGRVDYTPVDGTVVGASLYTGRVDHKMTPNSINMTLWDIHGKTAWKGLEVKALYAAGTISNVAELNAEQGFTGTASVGEAMFGGYVEVAYDVFRLLPDNRGHQLSPFIRYERYDTQAKTPDGFTGDPSKSATEATFGLTYKPIPEVAIKIDHQYVGNQAHTGLGSTNIGFGYLF